jgi:tetratricopeptide (TPR) repeat protein
MKDNFQEFFSDSILKFESMIKSNKFLFFDIDEFESIIIYYLESGNSSMANKAIKMAVDQYPNNTSILLLKVEALIFENKIEEAEKIIDLLFEFETNNSEIIIQKSRILSKRKKHTDSIGLLKKIKKDCEFYSDALIMIGKEYLFIDDFENAKEKFKEYINDYQLDYAVLNNLLYCYDAIGNTDSTINYLNDFLEINPYCEVAWHQLGKQYLKKELYKEAITAFDFAIISDDSFVGAYLEMGKVL